MGFTELLSIAVIGLVVIGPKRLPEAIRNVALFIGRLRRMMSSARTEFEKEFGVDEIRQQLHNEQIMEKLGEPLKPLSENRVERSPAPKIDTGENTNTDTSTTTDKA